jgi:hypothetical protein
MNKFQKILLCLLSLLIPIFAPLAAQNDTSAVVKIENIIVTGKYEVEFDVNLYRMDERWLYWANGSFQFAFDTTADYQFNANNHSITYLPGTSDLNVTTMAGVTGLPTDDYLITPRIIGSKFSLTVAGPDSIFNCYKVLKDTPLKIGRFRIENKIPSSPPTRFKWLTPYSYYQALAYKTNKDSVLLPDLFRYNSNDNIEINDEKHKVEYVAESYDPRMIIKNFHAEYMGSLLVRCTWETESEAFNEGFVVKRSDSWIQGSDSTKINYDITAGSYKDSPYYPQLIGLGTSKKGQKYEMWDTVPYRGINYCYKLFNQYKYVDTLSPNAISCIMTPNSVIRDAMALENPFNYSTTIKFWYEDDVMVDMRIYDLKGRLVEALLNSEIYKYYGKTKDLPGSITDNAIRSNLPYGEIKWTPKDLAQQGLYEVVIIGTPVKDPTVEKSVMVIKLQYVR